MRGVINKSLNCLEINIATCCQSNDRENESNHSDKFSLRVIIEKREFL